MTALIQETEMRSAPSIALRRRIQIGMALAAILLRALVARIYRIDSDSLWLDEFLTMELSTGRGMLHEQIPLNTIIEPAPAFTSLQDAPGATRIWSSMKTITHPPLVFLLLNFLI